MTSIRRIALATALAIGLAACGGDSEEGAATAEPIAPIAAPAGQSWVETAVETPEGGILLGNPDAPIKLVEYVSHTCPACAAFAAEAADPLKEKYVSTGVVSDEMRNQVHNALDLALVDSDDPLEAGLEIYAQPPGKRLTSLNLLSGGEQALTATALIFALFLTNPAPICVLDEVDAPLDDANIDRFCDLLDSMVEETQTRYLIVTHNAVTMSRMHRLFGVTMVEKGVSRLVSVDLGEAELLAAE